MSRVNKRPTALLDGNPEATQITVPGSDAERCVNDGRVFEKIPPFLGSIAVLAEPGIPRLAGQVRFIHNPSHKVAVIRGEDVAPDEDIPVYGFSLSPDGVREFVGIGRYTGEFGEHEQMLAWADLHDLNQPIFRSPDLLGVIQDEAQISELIQLLAIGEDATEWALD